MNDVRIDIIRWHRHVHPSVYLVTCDLNVTDDVRDTFDFSYTCMGHIYAIVDDFGDLVPLYKLGHVRIFHQQDH